MSNDPRPWTGQEIVNLLTLEAGFTDARTLQAHLERMLAMGYIIEACGTPRAAPEHERTGDMMKRLYLPTESTAVLIAPVPDTFTKARPTKG